MVRSLSEAQLLGARLRAQLLDGERAGSVAAAAGHLAGLQAQAASPARLAVRARTDGLTAAGTDRAAGPDRAVTRTWAMHGTLHMVATRDVRWMTGLFGPVFAARGRRRHEHLGLDEATCETALAALGRILGKRARLTIEPFTALPRASLDGLAAEAADIGRFLGIDVALGQPA